MSSVLNYLPPKEGDKEKPDRKVPSDFDDEASFLTDMRKQFDYDQTADRFNIDAGTEDLAFFVGDQWNASVRSKRERAKKPVLTVNRLPAFVAQVVGQRRMNETTIKVIPDAGADTNIAKIREDLVRSIQKISRADIAYDKALENQVICGIGNFGVQIDYTSDDVFDQEIKICSYPNAFSVLWDRMSSEPTGQDATRVFVIDSLTTDEFKARWPWASPGDVAISLSNTVGYTNLNGWFAQDVTRIVSYWRVRTRKRTLALMQDGSTQDITDTPREQMAQALQTVVQRPDGSPIIREVDKRYAEMYLCSALDILEGPYELPIDRVPVFRVPGWEVSIGDQKHRWGLVRFLKDPQRLHNFGRSSAAERLMAAPRAQWLATKEAVAGHEKEWRNANNSDDPLLIYNEESGQAPQRVAPPPLEQAWEVFAEQSAQDIKDISNIHEANLGMPSNEVSGAAIMARQRVSDTGTVLYHDNLNQAIEQCGYVVNQLIGTVYDTPRIIRVVGDDDKQALVAINQPNPADPDHPLNDLTSGRYSVSIITGPNYATKRMEALAGMTSLANAAPQLLSNFADYYVMALDMPYADKIAERIRRTMPPGVLGPDEMTPDMEQAAQAKGQQAQQAQQIEQAAATAKINADQSTAAVNFARAKNFEAEAESAPQKLAIDQTNAASQAADRQLRGSLEAIKTAHDGG